jgi:hypothetical protein
MTLRSSLAAAPRRRTTRLLLAAALLLLPPVVFLSGACVTRCWDCEPEPLVTCTRSCGSEDPRDYIEVYDSNECPPGTLPAEVRLCVTECGGEIVFEGCAWECPAGTFEDPSTKDCYAECSDPPLATVCASAYCPAGLMDESACYPGGCDGEHRCVLSCEERVIVWASCDPCAEVDETYIELSSCPALPDAGIVDGGPTDAGPDAG